MSHFQHFWCRTDRFSKSNWVIINLDKISSIRYPEDDDDYYLVDIDGNLTYTFTRKELDILLKAMNSAGHKLFDNDGRTL